MRQPTLKIIGLCFLLSFVILLFASPDSYTHDLYQRTDSANFFTSGKSLFNGLIPYVDFADSKGPLLWIIYGLAYLINSYSYVGVFWMSVLWYTLILYIIFKLAFLFLGNNKQAFWVVVLMIATYLSPWFHYEIRAEDWLHLFIALAFYHICRFLYTDKGKEPKSLYFACFVLGICLIATFFIKYNCTVMLGLTYIYMLYAIIRERKNILISFLCLFVGVCVLALPWIIYSLHAGCYEAFIQEYITNTLKTVENSNTIEDYIHEWLLLTYDTHIIFLFASSCIGAYAMSKKVNKYRYFFLFSFLAFFSIAIHRCVFLHWYYITVCLFFLIWIYIFIVDILSNHKYIANTTLLRYIVAISIIYTTFANTFFWGFLTPTWFFKDSTARSDYYRGVYYMSQIDQPTIIYYYSGTLGLETPVKGLPATRYWTTQVGATKNMVKLQERAIVLQEADFIVAADNEEFPINETDAFIKNSGYHALFAFKALETYFIFYTKHNLQDPPENFHVKNTDILMKRNIFNK